MDYGQPLLLFSDEIYPAGPGTDELASAFVPPLGRLSAEDALPPVSLYLAQPLPNQRNEHVSS